MRVSLPVLVCFLAAAPLGGAAEPSAPDSPTSGTNASIPLAGSVSCRDCHARFYQLWSTSHHGLAMQPYTPEFARRELTTSTLEITVGAYRYRADVNGDAGWVLEKGPQGEKKYKMEHVMGGKTVYYFLTPLDRGRLQTLPVAYDVHRKQWIDMAGSGVRHFPGLPPDEPFFWTEWPYTFNTACYNCHVSQVATNYDLKADTYHTVWAEPGINCETCHGPAGEHVKVAREKPPDEVAKDLRLISTKKFTVEQHNSSCSGCHAKGSPLTQSFQPRDRFFDHFDLVTLEHPDFYPDGRDLGENYTFTSWRMSPCVKARNLSCMHCHTSSGRFRFKDAPNKACLPCHQARVETATEHTHHAADSKGGLCISCHMPLSRFATMQRSDHSMRPPMPAATLAFQSPNACTMCHEDQDAAWAEQQVKTWHPDDYESPTLRWAGLVDEARKTKWARLDEMLAYLAQPDREEIVANSLVRLIRTCNDERKWNALLRAMDDPSPLVRSSAAEAAGDRLTSQTVTALLNATRDDYRLVRVRAAGALAAIPPGQLEGPAQTDLDAATSELLASFRSRLDDGPSHYNLGNFYTSRQDFTQAVAEYETAARLRPEFVQPLVNASLVYNTLGQNDKAEDSLRRALRLDPKGIPANLNLGLLLGEMGKEAEAEKAFRAVLQQDPKSAVAAYNLGVILSRDRPVEAIDWCRKAAALNPREPKYAYTLAFYQQQDNLTDDAINTLRTLLEHHPEYPDAYILLGDLFQRIGVSGEAEAVYRQGLERAQFSPRQRFVVEGKLQALRPTP